VFIVFVAILLKYLFIQAKNNKRWKKSDFFQDLLTLQKKKIGNKRILSAASFLSLQENNVGV